MKKQETPPFKFDNIFMVAADVRAVTFDRTAGVEKVGPFWGKKKEEHEGKAILRLAKHKVHVCWYGGDMALSGRKIFNWGRAALGKNGLGPEPLGPSSYIKTLLEDPEGKFVNKNCTDWNPEGEDAMLCHSYQTGKQALAYYPKQMRDNCD